MAKLDVSHLCFADDLFVFARGDLNPASTLFLKKFNLIVSFFIEYFAIFSQDSSLQANMGKNSIYFEKISNIVKERIIHFGYSIGHFKYLGISLSTKKLSLIK